MNNANDPATEPSNTGSVGSSPSTPFPAAGEPAIIPGFFPPALVLSQLSAVRETQPVAAIATANQHKDVLTGEFLSAIERGLANPAQDFAERGMLFNYAAYFLAKWREPRAYPLFLRWFSLPGDDAFELGGDTVMQHGARFLASVCGGDVQPIKQLILNREANALCRGQALAALGVLSVWGELPREEVEIFFLFLAREGLDRTKSEVWHELASTGVQLEFVSLRPELRRAIQEGLIDSAFMGAEDLDAVEGAPSGTLLENFVKRRPRITDVAEETRWWAGFHRNQGQDPTGQEPEHPNGIVSAGEQYIAPAKVGRNDPCPCGSGKKFKKCHGQ